MPSNFIQREFYYRVRLEDIIQQINLPGNTRVQSFSSDASPLQGSPPHRGLGDTHDLSRLVFPLLHGVHNDHAVYPPLTREIQMMIM